MSDKIVVDAFGGDHAPDEIVKGCAIAIQNHADVELTLVGNKQKIIELLNKEQCDESRIEIVHASEIIGTDEEPVRAIRTKKDSSLVIALQMIKEKKADCLISAGSTGALLAGSTLIAGRIKGVKRPALSPLFPTLTGKQVLVLDIGANVDCKPAYLEQFALMGDVYMKKVMNIEKPRIALLNNGTEEGKGNELSKETYEILKHSPLHFVGNCEAREVMSGEYDVVVTDGFAGNIFLKSVEGTVGLIMKILKRELMKSARTKIGAVLAKPAFASLKAELDYESVGGSLLLGIDGGIIKAHGNSKAYAFSCAIAQARNILQSGVIDTLRQSFQAESERGN